MKLTYKQVIKAWNKSVKNHLPNYYEHNPKFHCGQVVIVRTKEPDLDGWTWMDECRLRKKGKSGIVVNINHLTCGKENHYCDKYSPFDYRVRFKDGREIVFVEEHLREGK